MDAFVAIAEGLDVGPALAELGEAAHFWIDLHGDTQLTIPLTGMDNGRLLEAELPETWRLIEHVHALAAKQHGDRGALVYARIGLLPPGTGYPPHVDGIDGERLRRYHIALKGAPGAELVIEGEAKCYAAGEAWWIDAARMHSIANRGETDRILILFDTLA